MIFLWFFLFPVIKRGLGGMLITASDSYGLL